MVSAVLRDEIAAWFGVPRSHVIAIPNGIDSARFRPPSGFDRAAKKRELLGGDYRMVTNIGRLMPQKGQRYFIEAAAQISATRPDVRFLIVGDGALRAELEELARVCGVAEKVILAGIRTDIPEILAASDLFVLPSLWEGLPLSLLEAMAAGCPAIATDVGGVGDVLTHEAVGLLVPSADVPALAAAITACLDRPEEARLRAAAAEAMVRAKYDTSTMIRKWEAVYLHELRRG